MEIKSYRDMEGNKVVKGDRVEIIWDNDEEIKIKIVEAIEKKGHLVLVRFEGI